MTNFNTIPFKKLLFAFIFLIWLPLNLNAQNAKFEAEVTYRKYLGEISSASGILFYNNSFYIVSDNSQWLYKLDQNYALDERILLADEFGKSTHPLSGYEKPDFEAIAEIPWGKDNDIIIFGSGSAAQRENGIKIDYDIDNFSVRKIDLNDFYKHLRKKADLDEDQFNIEGAARWNDKLMLLNRGSNHLFMLETEDLKAYINKGKKEPKLEIYQYNLPSIQGNNAGFSGCCMMKGENILLFTASVENTPDWISDGEILGSYIGLIDLDEAENHDPVCIQIFEENKPIKDKVESIINIEKSKNTLKLIAVTDNDNGISELLEITLTRSKPYSSAK